MATSKPRIPVTLEPELLEQVQAYQYQCGITSLSKAIRQLVRIGLSSLEGGKIPIRVMEPRSRRELGLPEQERELLAAVRGLEPAQKAALLRVLEIAGERAETGQTREQIDVLPDLTAGTGSAHGHCNS